MKEWNREDVKCIGTITLRLSSSIHILAKDHSDSTKELWEWLKAKYDTPSIGAVFKDFNDTMNIVIPLKAHPQKAVDEMASHFSCIDNFVIGLEAHLEAMITISKLPVRYSTVRQMYAQLGTSELKQLTLGKVKLAVLNAYTGDLLLSTNGGPSNTNKLTNVHCSNGVPNFNDQQHCGKKGNQSQQPNQGQGNGDDGEKKKRKHSSGKKKKVKKDAHTHAADADEDSQSQSLQFSPVGGIFGFGPAHTDLNPSTSDVCKHSIAPMHCPSTLGLKIHKKTCTTIECAHEIGIKVMPETIWALKQSGHISKIDSNDEDIAPPSKCNCSLMEHMDWSEDVENGIMVPPPPPPSPPLDFGILPLMSPFVLTSKHLSPSEMRMS